jgi:hypothetical protein
MLPLVILHASAWNAFLDRLKPPSGGAGEAGPDMAVVVFVLLAGWGLALLASVAASAIVRWLSRSADADLGEPSFSPLPGTANLAGSVVFWLVFAAAAMLALDHLGAEHHFVLFAGIIVLAIAGSGIAVAWRLGITDVPTYLLAEYLQMLEDRRKDKSS